MTRAVAVQASGVSFVYQEGTRALDRVDFYAYAGEFLAMLASNGSGKTTLIKVLTGLLKPCEGVVRIQERDIRQLPLNLLYHHVGVVVQNPVDQLFAATVAEDVAYGPRNLGLEEEDVQQRVCESLRYVDAAELHDRAIHHLSYGEQKRVAVAGVLAMRPSIIILDEPTAGLDPAGEKRMMGLLHRLNREHGITVIVATHSVDLLPLFAERIYVLQHGKVLKQGSADEIFCDPEMLESACLRLPYVATLLHKMKRHDGVPINGLPLTVGEARKRLLELIPDDIMMRADCRAPYGE